MSSIDKFLSEVYSEELHPISEQEYDEVMQAMAEDDFAGYAEWSESLDSPCPENFEIREGRVFHKPQPPRGQFVAGIEI
jgi:hypothetical protein